MLYTIGEMARSLNVPPSTLRYYDKEGLLFFVERSDGGIRMFKDADYEWLFIIDCLKKTGMSLKDIRIFIDWARQGDETIEQRLEMFKKQRELVKEQIAQLQETLDVLEYKCWYYETAKAAGTTAAPRTTQQENIPENIRYVREKSKQMHRLK